MNHPVRGIHVVLGVLASIAWLQAASAQPSAAPPEAPPATVTTETATAIEAPAAVPRPRVVMLPIEFTVYELSAGGQEAMPDWTAAARKNLDEGLNALLRTRANLDFLPLPDLSDEERKVLDAHLGVVRLISLQGSQLAGKDWAARRAEFDRQIGPGLAWLREKTGADYAVFVNGAQVEQSAGLVFTQILSAAAGVVLVAGGGKYVSASLIDLSAGEVKWFNSTAGSEVLGVGSIDFRDAGASARVLAKLVEPYPAIPALEARR